jgi:hypothetical protein
MLKKLFVVLILLSIPAGFLFADRPTEVIYPNIPQSIRPVTTRALLPEYIKYVFSFIIILSGIICFGSLVYSGTVYLTSAGNPVAQKEATSRIWATFIGILIIFSSYLILKTINPQLVNIHVGIESLGGVTLYTDSNCGQDGGEARNFIVDSKSFGTLRDDPTTPFVARSLRFVSKDGNPAPGDLEIALFNGENFAGTPLKLLNDNLPCHENIGEYKSIRFSWQLPGVYLCNEPLDANGRCQGKEVYLAADTALLDPQFNNEIKGIRFKDGKGPHGSVIKYGAVLHEGTGWTGKCLIVDQTTKSLPAGMRDSVSSVTIFRPIAGNYYADDVGNVHLCKKSLYADCYTAFSRYPVESNNAANQGLKEKVKSVYIEGKFNGKFLVALFEKTDFRGKCQVFQESDPNLANDPIGRCGCFLGFFCHSCVNSFKIIPTK